MTWPNESTIPSMNPYSRASAAVYQWSCSESSKIRDTVLGLIADDTGQPFETVHEDSLHDHWYTADQAREYGFIDHIVESFDQVMPRKKEVAA